MSQMEVTHHQESADFPPLLPLPRSGTLRTLQEKIHDKHKHSRTPSQETPTLQNRPNRDDCMRHKDRDFLKTVLPK